MDKTPKPEVALRNTPTTPDVKVVDLGDVKEIKRKERLEKGKLLTTGLGIKYTLKDRRTKTKIQEELDAKWGNKLKKDRATQPEEVESIKEKLYEIMALQKAQRKILDNLKTDNPDITNFSNFEDRAKLLIEETGTVDSSPEENELWLSLYTEQQILSDEMRSIWNKSSDLKEPNGGGLVERVEVWTKEDDEWERELRELLAEKQAKKNKN